MDTTKLRSAMTAVQAGIGDGYTIQIELTADDVSVYLKRGMGKKKIKGCGTFEDNLLQAKLTSQEPDQG